MLSIHPKMWEDAIFPREMVVSWQGDCFGSGLRLSGVLGDHFHEQMTVQVCGKGCSTPWTNIVGTGMGFLWYHCGVLLV